MSDKKDWQETVKTNTQKAWAETVKLSKRLKEDFIEYREQQKQTGNQTTEGITSAQLHLQPRLLPDECRVEKHTADEVVLKFQAARVGWKVTSYITNIFVFLIVFIMGMFAAFSNLRGGEANIAVLLILGLLGLVLGLHFIAYPNVKVIATKQGIKFGNLLLNRQYYGGVAIGYDRRSKEGPAYSQLRIIYGPWGEDTPYMLKSYKAKMILSWINLMIDSTAEPIESEHETDYGEREQAFE